MVGFNLIGLFLTSVQ